MADKKFDLFIWGLFLIFSILFGLVVAHVVTVASTGGTSFSVTEQNATGFFNITTNTTGDTNSSQINITLPSLCNFTYDSNGSSVPPIINFSNTSTTLMWENASGVTNVGGNESFWFNMTCAPFYVANITVEIANISGSTVINYTNLSIQVNDTTAPTIASNLSTSAAWPNYFNSSSIVINISVTDYNSTWGSCMYSFDAGLNNVTMVNESVSTSATVWTTRDFNATNSSIGDGWYNITIWCNDTLNTTSSGATYPYVPDVTNPLVPSFSCSPATLVVGYGTTCSCSGSTDATSGLNTSYGHVYTQKPTTLEPGTFTLTCKVRDLAGNRNSVTTTYTVGGTSDPIPSGGTVYSNTILEDEEEFDEIGSITKEVEDKTQIRIKINDEEHNIGITEVSETSVTIEIPGTGETTSMNIGDIKKFDVTGDGFYDVSVTLNSIEADKADVTMSYIHEEVPADEISDVGTGLTEKVGGLPIWLWIVIGVVVIIVLVALGIKAKKK